MKDLKATDSEYVSIHTWLRYHYGKANRCETPNCKLKPKRFEWALIKGKFYEKNRDNFMMLCPSHHRFR